MRRMFAAAFVALAVVVGSVLPASAATLPGARVASWGEANGSFSGGRAHACVVDTKTDGYGVSVWLTENSGRKIRRIAYSTGGIVCGSVPGAAVFQNIVAYRGAWGGRYMTVRR